MEDNAGNPVSTMTVLDPMAQSGTDKENLDGAVESSGPPAATRTHEENPAGSMEGSGPLADTGDPSWIRRRQGTDPNWLRQRHATDPH